MHVLIRHGTVDDETTDYKGLFLWLEKYTKPRKGLEGPFMGIANRRRIWGVCEQYAALYAPRVAAKARMHVADGEADRIWKGSKNLGVPVVIQPLPRKGLRTVTTQWITDIVQDTHRGGVLEAIWDVNRTLVGLAVTLTGKQRHVFGMDHGPNRTKEQVSLGEGCWIKSLVLHMPDMFLTERLETSIKGITVSCHPHLLLLQIFQVMLIAVKQVPHYQTRGSNPSW